MLTRLPPAPAWLTAVVSYVRMWPWIASLAAAVIVNLLVGALRQFDFSGISGFSTTNFGWLAFSVVGGSVLAWRVARSRAGRSPLRVLVSPVMSSVACSVAVTLMGVVFLPGQSVVETLTTDAFGRSIWVALAVFAVACVCEVVWSVVRHVRRAQ